MNDQVVRTSLEQQHAEQRDERRRAEVRAGDHRDATDGVEQPAEQERAEEVAGGEDHHETAARGSTLTSKKLVQDRPQVEGDGVVEERLADEEREAEDRAARVAPERDCASSRNGISSRWRTVI